MGAARHQVVARAFRGGAGQDRRLDIEEAVLVQVTTDAAGDAGAQLQLGRHFRTAQVDEAITQTGFLAHIGVLVQREGRGLGLVQHFQLVAQHLDAARGHVRVDRTGRTLAHLADDLDHVLAAHTVGAGEGLFAVRVEHHLGQAFAVTDIEENDPAVVTATVYPTAEGDFLAIQALVQLAAIVAAHHGRVSLLLSLEFVRPPTGGGASGGGATPCRTGRGSRQRAGLYSVNCHRAAARPTAPQAVIESQVACWAGSQ
ncbi:hypothetical protein D3C80_442350 [compost metagenome]